MEVKELKKIIVDWAIDCDISPNDFEWGDQWEGLMKTSFFLTFSIKNNCMLVEEFQALEKKTQARFLSISAEKDMLNILIKINYEAD